MKGMPAWKGYREHKQDHNTLLCCITWKTTTNLLWWIPELPLTCTWSLTNLLWASFLSFKDSPAWYGRHEAPRPGAHTNNYDAKNGLEGNIFTSLRSLCMYMCTYKLHHEKPVYINMYTGNILQYITQTQSFFPHAEICLKRSKLQINIIAKDS